jgi:hypothetical protein
MFMHAPLAGVSLPLIDSLFSSSTVFASEYSPNIIAVR